jgi:hypothetical protein
LPFPFPLPFPVTPAGCVGGIESLGLGPGLANGSKDGDGCADGSGDGVMSQVWEGGNGAPQVSPYGFQTPVS